MQPPYTHAQNNTNNTYLGYKHGKQLDNKMTKTWF